MKSFNTKIEIEVQKKQNLSEIAAQFTQPNPKLYKHSRTRTGIDTETGNVNSTKFKRGFGCEDASITQTGTFRG